MFLISGVFRVMFLCSSLYFCCQVVILEYKSIICAGFSCVLHIHSVVEEVEIAVS